MNPLDKIIFDKKSVSDIFKEIYNNSKKKETQISALISELKPLVTDIGDATLIVPLIKEYLEIGVKNDEQLIKMASIITRIILIEKEGVDNGGISDEEKAQLLKSIEDLQNPS